MTKVFGPGLFHLKFPFQLAGFLPHEIQNPLVVIGFEPKAVFQAAINLQIIKPVIEAFKRGGTDRATERRLPAYDKERPLLGIGRNKGLVFQLIQFSGGKPHAPATWTGLYLDPSIGLRLEINLALRTPHQAPP